MLQSSLLCKKKKKKMWKAEGITIFTQSRHLRWLAQNYTTSYGRLSWEWRCVTSSQWSVSPCIWLHLTEPRDPKTDNLWTFCLLCSPCHGNLLRRLKIRGGRCKCLAHTYPTKVPIHLQLVLQMEVGHFVSWRITFMWAFLDLPENEATNSF
jgi:hypothetical protein